MNHLQEYEEFSPAELARLFKRHRLLLFFSFLIIPATAFLFSIFLPQEFQTSTVVRIGTIGNVSIESAYQITAYMKNEAAIRSGRLPRNGFKVRNLEGHVEVVGVGRSAEESKDNADAVTAFIIQRHKAILDGEARALERNINTLTQYLTEAKRALRDNKTASSPIIVSQIKEEVHNLEVLLADAHKERDLVLSRQTVATIDAALPGKAHAPNPGRNVLLGVILAPLFWLIIALLMEMRSHRARSRTL